MPEVVVPTRTILRSQIKLAHYNPRVIANAELVALKRSLDYFGLVETPVWNETTGVLVGGHQRIRVLDDKFGYPGQDYKITVAVVNFNEVKEREANIALNNESMSGRYDEDLLKNIKIEFPDFSPVHAGFDQLTWDATFPDLSTNGAFSDDPNDPANADAKLIEEIHAAGKQVSDPAAPNYAATGKVQSAEEIAGIKERKKKFRDNEANDADGGMFAHIYFGVSEEWKAFAHAVGISPDEDQIDGTTFAGALGYDMNHLVRQYRERGT